MVSLERRQESARTFRADRAEDILHEHAHRLSRTKQLGQLRVQIIEAVDSRIIQREDFQFGNDVVSSERHSCPPDQ